MNLLQLIEYCARDVSIHSGNVLTNTHIIHKMAHKTKYTWKNELINIANHKHSTFNPYIFIHENAFEKIVCEIAAILSRPQCIWSSLLNIKVSL